MELTLYQQTNVFLWSAVIGAVLAAVYTVFAVIRELSPPGRIQLFLTDFLFMVIAAMINFVFALSRTNGRIRGYSVLAQAAVFFLLYLTAGVFIKRSAKTIKVFCEARFSKLSAPFVTVYDRFLLFIRQKCQILLKKIKK